MDRFNNINRNITVELGNAVGIALISQFLADIIFSFFSDNIIETDIIISDISIYYGAVSAGIVLVLLPKGMDRLEKIIITAVVFQYATNLVSEKTYETIEINEPDLVFSIILTEILMLSFDPKAVNDYYNKYNKRKHISKEEYETDRGSFEFLFFLFLSNLIAFEKNKKTTKSNK